MQNKLAPKIIPRILSLFLVLATIFTILPQQAFADDGKYNGDGGSTAGGSSNQGGAWLSTYQGYRMTIVTEQGWVVGSPVDFLFSDFPTGAEGYYESKVEDLGTRATANNYYRLEWMINEGSLKGAPNVPPALLWGDYGPGGAEGALGNGKDLKQWMIGDKSTIQGDFNSDNGWVKMLLNFTTSNIFVFKFPAKYDKYNNVPQVGADGRVTNSRTDIMAENKFVMLIEPIIWFRPKTQAGKGYGKIVYGTITNHADWSIAAKKSGAFDDGNLWWVGAITRRTGAWSLYLSKDEEFINRPGTWTIKAPSAKQGTQASVADLANNTIGYALHVYRVGDSPPPPPTGTSTCDEPNVPTPHQAPDPKDKTKVPAPQPGEDISKTRVYNIVKTYQEDKGEGAGMEHVTTNSRQNNPAQILIENEDKYVVKEWFISSTYNNPTGATTWENNKSQAPTTGDKGNSAGNTVKLKEPDSTLYVLLQRKIPVVVAKGDLIIRESQVTKAVETLTTKASNWGIKTMTLKITLP